MKEKAKIIAYIEADTYRQLKAKLTLQSETITKWLRRKADEELHQA